MALFKIFGNFASGNTTLPTSATQGFCYFDKNTGKFYIDTTNAVSGRMALNAEKETQQNQNASGDYRILLSGNANDTTEIAYINKNTNLRFNPGTQLLSVGGSISATGDLTITGDTDLNGETFTESITTNSLLVNGNANFVQIPTAPTPASDSNDTSIATTAFVMNAFTANDAMIFKGTIGTGGTVTALPATHKQGWTYRVITAGTYAGKVCEIGDMIICVTDGTAASNDHWTVVQTNIDGAVTGPTSATTEAIAIFNGTTGKIIKNSAKTITTATPASGSTSATIPTSNAVWAAITGASGYGKVGTVTSVQVQATSPVVSSTSTSQTGSLNTTISLANNYGDTKNPYAAKAANYVLAGPSSGTGTAVPAFRALVAADIPDLAWSKITSGNDDLKAIENLTGTSGLLKKTAANTWTLDTTSYTTNTGTVTSVQVQASAPLTSSVNSAQAGSLSTTISLTATTANYILAGPSSGSTTASPTYRKLVLADIPNLSTSYVSVTSGVTDVTVNSNRQLQKTINGTTTAVTQLAFVPGTGTNSAIGGGTGSYTPTASATASLAFGRNANSSAQYAIAIGLQTQATNQYAIAIGGRNSQIVTPIGSTTTTNLTAAGVAAIATGIGTVAEGNYSIASGLGSYSKGTYSVARGRMSYAYGSSQVVIGAANIIDENDEYALIIGNGTINAPASGAWSANRSNALTVDWDGNVDLSGGLKTNKITAPQESGSTTYTNGTVGQVLTTNGTNIYWGAQPAGLEISHYTGNNNLTTFYIKTDLLANDYGKMIYGYIIGNGYGAKNPIRVDFQAYNYTADEIIYAKQYDATNAIGEMSIIRADDNFIYFKVVPGGGFQTFKIFIYKHNENNGKNYAITTTTTAPTITKEVTLTKITGITSSNITNTAPSASSTSATIPTSKAVWDTVNNYVKKSGDTMTGNLKFNSTASVVLTSAAAAYESGTLKFTSGGVIGGDTSGDIGVYATKIYLRPGNSTTSSGVGIILGTTGSGSSLMVQLDPHATNKVNLGTSSLRYNDIYATNINISKIQAPTQSGGSTYGVGSTNQILKSNGTTVYWGNENIPGSDEITWNGSNLGVTPSPGNVESAIETVYNAITDTKNTVGATQSTSKVYLVGPTAQSTSAQSYSHTAVYAQDGAMAATSYKVAEKVILQYNTTTDALNFVFA